VQEETEHALLVPEFSDNIGDCLESDERPDVLLYITTSSFSGHISHASHIPQAHVVHL
jgi:hypothetical protein